MLDSMKSVVWRIKWTAVMPKHTCLFTYFPVPEHTENFKRQKEKWCSFSSHIWVHFTDLLKTQGYPDSNNKCDNPS